MSTTVAEVGERLFRLPDLGEGLAGAEIVAWRVEVGDAVTVDQVVVEVETAKAAVELPIPFPGVVLRLHADVGAELAVGEPLISVGPADGVRGNGAEPGEPSGEPAETRSGSVLVGYGTAPSTPSRRTRRPRAAAPRTEAVHAADAASTAGADAGPAAGADAAAGRSPATRADASGASGALQPSAVTSGDAGAASAGAGGSGVGAGGAVRAVDAGAGATGAGVLRPSAGAGGTAPDPAPDPGTVAGRRAGSADAPRVISPLVRRLAREHGVDVAHLTPSGPDRIVLRRDVEQAVAARDTRPDTGDERVPLRGMRLAIAEKVARSRTEIPDATTWVDVDATELVAARGVLRTAEPDRRIGLLALLARVCVEGLRRFPELNATVDTERREIVRLARIHLGFAAQTERGLVVPVVRDAHRRTTAELAAELDRLTALARSGGLTPTDLTGGTFTLNNYGVFGVDGSTPIINHPEAGMLGVGRIIDRPWVVDGALAVRKVTQLSLSFDHRVCDGGAAGGFLRFVADRVEHPAILLADL